MEYPKPVHRAEMPVVITSVVAAIPGQKSKSNENFYGVIMCADIW